MLVGLIEDMLRFPLIPCSNFLSGVEPMELYVVVLCCVLQESRCCLPVVGEEGRVMEAVRGGAVTVLCGETGSGKTTQLPQFLFEYGYAHPAGPW